jgi:hypothetical protein
MPPPDASRHRGEKDQATAPAVVRRALDLADNAQAMARLDAPASEP